MTNNKRITTESLEQRSGSTQPDQCRLAAVGEMALGIAHEVGNALTSVSGLLRLLKHCKTECENHENLDLLENEISRISQVMKELLGFARPGEQRALPADLDELTEQMVKMLGYTDRARKTTIQSIRNRQLPPVRISPAAFQQVVLNLLLNALDAATGDGHTVTIERFPGEDGWVCIAISDTGKGMTDEQMRCALEPFFTTKTDGKGTGLGLPISRRITEQYNGRLELRSTPGSGTTATVCFRAITNENDQQRHN